MQQGQWQVVATVMQCSLGLMGFAEQAEVVTDTGCEGIEFSYNKSNGELSARSVENTPSICNFSVRGIDQSQSEPIAIEFKGRQLPRSQTE